jgi:hypothetical protein
MGGEEERGGDSPKKKGGPQPRVESRTAPHAGYPESRNSLPRSSSVGHHKLMRLRCGLRSSGFHPQMACGHLVHQRERCKSAESRINLLHGTSPRYCDVDETRDWSRLSKIENDQFSIWRRQHRNRFSRAQEGNCYPHSCTFFTFPQRKCKAGKTQTASTVVPQ